MKTELYEEQQQRESMVGSCLYQNKLFSVVLDNIDSFTLLWDIIQPINSSLLSMAGIRIGIVCQKDNEQQPNNQGL